MITRAAQLNLGNIGSSDDQVRWFDEAMAAFATALRDDPPVLPHRFPAGSGGAEPFVILQGQALLAVLNQGQSSDDPRDLPPDELAAALMHHEQRRWRAIAGNSDWGSGTAPSQDVQGQAVAALALLGAETKPEAAEKSEAAQIVRRVPELRDARAERLAAVVSWAAGLYPDEPGIAPRIRPDLAGEWFVVSQLTANPDLAQAAPGHTLRKRASQVGLHPHRPGRPHGLCRRGRRDRCGTSPVPGRPGRPGPTPAAGTVVTRTRAMRKGETQKECVNGALREARALAAQPLSA